MPTLSNTISIHLAAPLAIVLGLAGCADISIGGSETDEDFTQRDNVGSIVVDGRTFSILERTYNNGTFRYVSVNGTLVLCEDENDCRRDIRIAWHGPD